jgi:hypothetical protein
MRDYLGGYATKLIGSVFSRLRLTATCELPDTARLIRAYPACRSLPQQDGDSVHHGKLQTQDERSDHIHGAKHTEGDSVIGIRGLSRCRGCYLAAVGVRMECDPDAYQQNHHKLGPAR